MRAAREVSADTMSECWSIVRARAVLGSPEASASQEDTVLLDKEPSADLGDARRSDERSEARSACAERFSSIGAGWTITDFEGEEPMVE